MAKLTDERIKKAFEPYLEEGEELRHWAIGVKQPNMALIVFLVLLAILPGLIAAALLTKTYLVGLTDRRLLVLEIKSGNNTTVKQITDYGLEEVQGMKVWSSTGAIFTHIRIHGPDKPFVAKFHRAVPKDNRAHAMAIAKGIVPAGT